MTEHLIHEVLAGSAAGVQESKSRFSQSILYITPQSSSEAVLIRILLGSTTFDSVRDGSRWDQLDNFSVIGKPARAFRTRNQFRAHLKAAGIPQPELDSHLRRNIRQEGYYKDLVAEVILALARTNKGEHTLAFLHIYRLLERISFAFPVIYAARSTDFKATYTVLREYLGGGTDKGELGFFRKFVETSIDGLLAGAIAKVDLAPLQSSDRPPVYSTIKKFLPPNSIHSEIPDLTIEFPYSEVLDLLVNLRNRFFHFSSNHTQNISSIDLPVCDQLFEHLNEIFLNWLAVIYFEVLRGVVSR